MGAGGFSPYAYVNNDPVNNFDPTGHYLQPISGGARAADVGNTTATIGGMLMLVPGMQAVGGAMMVAGVTTATIDYAASGEADAAAKSMMSAIPGMGEAMMIGDTIETAQQIEEGNIGNEAEAIGQLTQMWAMTLATTAGSVAAGYKGAATSSEILPKSLTEVAEKHAPKMDTIEEMPESMEDDAVKSLPLEKSGSAYLEIARNADDKRSLNEILAEKINTDLERGVEIHLSELTYDKDTLLTAEDIAAHPEVATAFQGGIFAHLDGELNTTRSPTIDEMANNSFSSNGFIMYRDHFYTQVVQSKVSSFNIERGKVTLVDRDMQLHIREQKN
ncbi:MAG: hypothetical protein O2809_09140, partial [Proteobacteria bacterium]|nr:hypothetical protein [Pseudomonadota bacterium]